ncbi:hypothetical protein NDU88_004430 [Pleurodeles waltl]|uniref:Uncharacterized protein n=1 Tax=Pleurodeles waltl TaxID=8319 RepID=A0AAV7RI85_PLEWA|nr:hypothetical protein NDU88_004430 [Pleurodeles waltl]
MFRILAVAYPELDGYLRASQQTQGEAPEVGQCPTGEGEDSCRQSRSQGPRGSVESAVTPPKVGKGQKKAPRSGKSSTAEKAAIIPAAQDATASPSVTGQETITRVSAQEGSTIVTGQETTARVSAQEGSTIITGQETTARRAPAATAPLGNEGPPWHTPLHRAAPAGTPVFKVSALLPGLLASGSAAEERKTAEREKQEGEDDGESRAVSSICSSWAEVTAPSADYSPEEEPKKPVVPSRDEGDNLREAGCECQPRFRRSVADAGAWGFRG